MNAILSVIGKDTIGIVADVSVECAKYNANITDVSQSILGEYFAMIMVVNIDRLSVEFTEFADRMKESGKKKNLEIQVMHEDIFNSMHKI
ncbi:MAG: ACT domain-containing protein [Fusobacteriaceae bacterium]|jgi:ACT domain-containing protein|nr:ACT domain-containing protein [Fusobacteriaceae bacterium]